MSTHEHDRAARGTAVSVAILVVSTTRTGATDETGPLLRAACEDAGHAVIDVRIVNDDALAIGRALDGVVALGARVVLVTGGTGLSARDVTPDAIVPRFDRQIPGFGELFRARSFAEIGPAAILSRAEAGIVGRTAVFLLPGSRDACRTALEIALPVVRHLVHQLDKERVAEASVWRATLEAHGGQIERSLPQDLPTALTSTPGVRPLLDRATDRAGVRFADEDAGVLLGYPDLVRDDARVLLVRSGRPFGEVVALHRPASALVPREGGWFGSSQDLDIVSQRWTGAPDRGPGELFAVDGDRVFVIDDGVAHVWDGSARTVAGDPAHVVLQLVRKWTAEP